MKTLVYGAGVLGSLYAGLLQEAGKDVSLLARGKRLQELKEHGLIVENFITGNTIKIKINLVEEQLSAKDDFDLILVIMQKTHIASILSDLGNYSTNAIVVFLGNNGTGIDEYKEILDPSRILLGFPSAAGKRDGHIIRVIFDPEKSRITLGESSGKITLRLRKVQEFLESAGIPVILSNNIDAWLKTHIALISPLANAYFMLKSEHKTLSESPRTLDLAVRAILEGVRVLKKLGYPILPKKFRLAMIAPKMLKKKISEMYTGKWFDIALKGHADYAVGEMRRIADEFQVLVKKSGLKAPSINELYKFIPN